MCPAFVMLGEGHTWEEMIEIPSYGILIEHPDGLVLFDTGTPMDSAYPEIIPGPEFGLTWTEEDTIPSRLASVGYTPEDIKYVVVSHLHMDHAGDLHLFKNAEVIVSETEYRRKTGEDIPEEEANTPELLELWRSDVINWKLIEDKDFSLLPGIDVIAFGEGHSYGMLGLSIESKELGHILAVSDVIYHHHIFEGVIPGVVPNLDQFKANVAYVQKLKNELSASVWCGHDLEQYLSLRHAPEGYYE